MNVAKRSPRRKEAGSNDELTGVAALSCLRGPVLRNEGL